MRKGSYSAAKRRTVQKNFKFNDMTILGHDKKITMEKFTIAKGCRY